MLTSFAGLVLRDPLAGKRLRADPEEQAAEPAGYGRSPTSRPGTWFSSTPAPAAASATKSARPTRPASRSRRAT